MLGLLKSTFVLCLVLSIQQTNALSCYSCYGCKTYSSPNSTQQVCGASTSTAAISVSSTNETNLTTALPTTIAALNWQCSKSGITIAGSPSWTYGCDSDCSASNTGGLFSVLINAGTYCCNTNFCNDSVSLMKSGLGSTLLSLALIYLVAVLNY